jgi:histidine triad (HIT) family protein
MSEDCLFCKIIKGEVPAAKIYENPNVISFLDIMPASKGHCLVIPKKHAVQLDEMDDDDLTATILAAKKVAKALSLSFGNAAFNVVMNNGKDAGQVVNHAHIHLIPRFKKDRLRIKWSHLEYEEGEIQKVAGQIKNFL